MRTCRYTVDRMQSISTLKKVVRIVTTAATVVVGATFRRLFWEMHWKLSSALKDNRQCGCQLSLSQHKVTVFNQSNRQGRWAEWSHWVKEARQYSMKSDSGNIGVIWRRSKESGVRCVCVFCIVRCEVLSHECLLSEKLYVGREIRNSALHLSEVFCVTVLCNWRKYVCISMLVVLLNHLDIYVCIRLLDVLRLEWDTQV
jgi:hypothetical protein